MYVRPQAARLRQREVVRMIAPGVRPVPRIPRGRSSFPLSVIAVVVTILAWAALVHSPAATDVTPAQPVHAAPGDFHTVVYSDPTTTTDVLYMRSTAPGAQPQLITTFPVTAGLHAHGNASPAGTDIAVLAADSATATSDHHTAKLAVISLPSGIRSEMAGTFAYLSRLVWSPDGRYIYATSPAHADDSVDITQTDTYTGHTKNVAQFSSAFEAVPLGFSASGSRLFIVTVDKSGSTLWEEQDGKVEKVALLSAGRTRDWKLSPDAAWLAFVDVLGSGSTGLVGRTLTIATGAVNTVPATANEVSPVWAPGSDVPVFGGPGGQLQLTSPLHASAYPAPLAYSPDGTGLVATIYAAAPDGDGPSAASPGEQGSLELVSPTHRTLLTDAEGAAFFGWVRNPD